MGVWQTTLTRKVREGLPEEVVAGPSQVRSCELCEPLGKGSYEEGTSSTKVLRLWPSNIPLYAYTTSSSSPLSMDISVASILGCCKCAAVNIGVHASFWIRFSPGVTG